MFTTSEDIHRCQCLQTYPSVQTSENIHKCQQCLQTYPKVLTSSENVHKCQTYPSVHNFRKRSQMSNMFKKLS